MAKNNHKGGESLPLARTRKQSLRLLSTPSPRGKAPKTPKVSREFCETKLDSERKRTNNAPDSTPIEAPYELVVKMTSCHFYFSSFHFALQNKNSRIYC